MKVKKLSVYLVVLLSFLFVLSLSSTNASASTWHKGIPSIKGLWRSGYKNKNAYPHNNQKYIKFTVDIEQDGLNYGVIHKLPSNNPWHNKYGQVTNDLRGVVNKPVYKYLSHNKYFIKSSAKFMKDAPNNSVYIIQKSSKHSVKIWIKGNKYEPAFHKWTYLGNFNKMYGDILK